MSLRLPRRQEPLTEGGAKGFSRNWIQWFTDLAKIKLLGGEHLTDISLTGVGNTIEVPHNLGRAYTGWIVTKTDAAGAHPLDYSATAGVDTAAKVALRGATQTLDIWIF